MTIQFLPEEEKFGSFEFWRLISRVIDGDGRRVSVRAMGIQGRGIFVQTARQEPDGGDGWQVPVYDEPQFMTSTMIYELIERAEEGAYKCLARDLMSVDMARKRFGGGKKGQAPDINAGDILTQERRVEPQIVTPDQMPPEVLAQMKAAAGAGK